MNMFRKAIAALLLAAPFSAAQAAITLVACEKDANSAATSITVTKPTGTIQNDVAIGFAVRSDNVDDGTWVDPADWTQGDLQDETLGSTDFQGYWGYKVWGATDGDPLTFDFGSGSTAAGMGVIVCTFRGVDTSTPIDVTYSDGSHFNSNENSVNTAAQPITTVTNDAWVLLLHSFSQEVDAVCGGTPSGYTLVDQVFNCTSTAGRRGIIFRKEKATAGVETPGDFTHTDTDLDADGRNYTIALRPASGSAPAFSVTPIAAPAANGVTISGTATGTATITVKAVGVSPGDGTPTCTQIQAGQNDGGTAALATGSDTWVDGVSNNFTATGSNPIAVMDYHVCARNGVGDSSVVSLPDEDRSPRAGFAIITMTSVASTGVCNQDSYFTPDCATGDVFEYEDDTNENANCNISFEADGDFVLTPVGAGDCDGAQSFEISYENVSSATTGLFTAPTVGNFTTDDTIHVNNSPPEFTGPALEFLLAIDENMDNVNLDGYWTDLDGDAVTVTATGLPAGLSITANVLDGTPTACTVASVTFRGTDVAGNYTEVTGEVAVGPRMTDLVGMTEAAAIAALDALCP